MAFTGVGNEIILKVQRCREPSQTPNTSHGQLASRNLYHCELLVFVIQIQSGSKAVSSLVKGGKMLLIGSAATLYA